MTDKNGKTMNRGDVVVVTGAFFKNDNGMFRVTHAPGDDNWLGNYCSLTRLNKDGTESKRKYNLSSWPISNFCNDWRKNREAKAHNAENATIEVVEIAFEEKAPKAKTGEVKFMYNGIKIDGELFSGWYSKGKYRDLPAGTICIYARNYKHFPKIAGLNVVNNTETMIDYFEKDRIYVTPSNKHYEAVNAAYEKAEARDRKRYGKAA